MDRKIVHDLRKNIKMSNTNLSKNKWADDNFDTMQWHDCKIYAIAFDSEKFEIRLDIDFVVEWVKPKEGETFFKFWVSPATLVFKHVHEISITTVSVDLIIQDITRSNPTELGIANHTKGAMEYNWNIETTNGEITFKSIGYDQFARERPVLIDRQAIGLSERNGLSFDVVSYQL
jgi:hypothetical protein